MDQTKLRSTLEDLLTKSAELLLQRVQDGTATASDLAVARAMLKDAGVQALPTPKSPLGKLARELPVFDESAIDYDAEAGRAH